MKKLFGVFILSFAFILASCNFSEFSGRTGEVSFSVPVAELARDVGDENTDSMAIIVQIAGSKGYYSRQIQRIDFTSPTEGANDATDKLVNSIVKEKIFSFESLPVKQKYTIMMDVLYLNSKVNPPEEDPVWTIHCAAEKEDVSIKAGSVSSVQLVLSKNTSANTVLNVGYIKNGATVTQSVSNGELVNNDVDRIPASIKFAKSGDFLFFGGSGREMNRVSSVGLALTKNSHFRNGGTVITKFDMSDEWSLMDYFKMGDLWKSIDSIIQFDNYLIQDDGFYFTIEEYQGVFGNICISGAFELDDDIGETAGYYRYRARIPMEQLIGGGSNSLKNGETIVFLINENDLLVPSTEFNEISYNFLKDYGADINSRYLDNNTISKECGVYIIPANLVNGDEKYLQLYFDKNSPIENLEFDSVPFRYRIYSAQEKVYAFYSSYVSYIDGQGEPHENKRFETKIPLNDKINVNQIFGKNLTVKIGGTLTFESEYSTTIAEEILVESEFYDNNGNECLIEGHNPYYHTLSNSTAENTNKQQTVGESGLLGEIVLRNLTEPHDFSEHDLRFQCYSNIDDDFDKILIIKNFSITASLSSQ